MLPSLSHIGPAKSTPTIEKVLAGRVLASGSSPILCLEVLAYAFW